MLPSHIVYFNFEYPHSPHTGFTKLELYRGIRDALFKAPKGPVLFVFPEAVLGRTPISRAEGKALAKRIHQLLRQRGNAYAFYATLEKTGQQAHKGTMLSAGYLITPRKTKPYLVYPKVSPTTHIMREKGVPFAARKETYLHAINNQLEDDLGHPKKPMQEYDIDVLDHHAQKITPTGRDSDALLVKWIDQWLRRNEFTKGFPRIKVGGRRIEYRICADVGRNAVTERLARGKKELIVVSAQGLEHPSLRAELVGRETPKRKGAVFLMDGTYKHPIFHARHGIHANEASYFHYPVTKIRFERGNIRTPRRR